MIFDPKFVIARFQQLITECCNGQRQCTIDFVKEQIEDGCFPGRVSGIRVIQ